MTRGLYRSMVLITALALLSLGMRLSDALRVHDAEGSLQPMDWLVLAGLLVTALCGVAALLQVRIPDSQPSSGAPAA